MPFVWIIRTWCSLDTYWEAVRSSKDYDKAFTKPELVLEEIQNIVVKEQTEFSDKEFLVELPTLEQIKNRPFLKFLSVVNAQGSKDSFTQNWHIERLTQH